MYKTAKVKLHNPSMAKRAVLLKAFGSYHLLCDRLLDAALRDQEAFWAVIGKPDRKGKLKFNDRNGKKYFPKQHLNILNSFALPYRLKMAACVFVTGVLTKYRALKEVRPNTSAPTFRILSEESREDVFNLALDQLKNCTGLEEERMLGASLSRDCRVRARYLPLSFTNCDIANQSMTLLFNPKKKTYSALLNIAPPCRKEKLKLTPKHNLYDFRTGKQFVKPIGTAMGVLFSLEMGKRITQRFFKSGAVPKEGKLVYDADQGEFYLHIAFEFKPTKIKTETFLGIDRGIVALCAWTVINQDHKQIYQGLFGGQVLRDYQRKEEQRIAKLQHRGKVSRSKARGRFADHLVQQLTNKLAETALKYKSQVYVENLSNLTNTSKPRNRSNYNSLLNRQQYQKVLKVLNYKLEQRGLPSADEIHPAYTSMTCSSCGNCSRENRAKRVFKCVSCGHTDNSDLNASNVIAMKGRWHYMKVTDKKKLGVVNFSDYLEKVL